MQPLGIIWVQTIELLETPPDRVVEGHQLSLVYIERRGASSEHKLTKGRTGPKERQGDLGIRELPNGVQTALYLGGPLCSK